MDGITFEFNDIISLYKKNDSEWRRYVSLGIRHYILIYGIKKNIPIIGTYIICPIINSKLIISQYPLGITRYTSTTNPDTIIDI